MNSDSHDLQTLRTLIVKSQHESLNESEIAQLNLLICTEDGAIEAASLLDQLGAFTDSGSLDSLPMAEVLSEALGGQSFVSDMPSAAVGVSRSSTTPPAAMSSGAMSSGAGGNERGSDRSRRALWWVAIAASHLLVATLAWWLASVTRANVPTAMRGWESIPTTGSNAKPLKLVSMTACVWRGNGDLRPTLGKQLRTGDAISLVEGIAELKLGEGTSGEAVVRIEGPARVHVGRDGQLEIPEGSLTAKSLGIGTENLIIDTPMGRVIVDGLSSVGLVARKSDSEVHLFAGSVRVKPYQVDPYRTDPYQLDALAGDVTLESGEAVRISGRSAKGPAIVKFQASKAAFVSARSLGFDPLNLGESYVRAVMDSRPSVYWRFERLEGEYPYYIENQGSVDGMNAIVVGEPAWRQYGNNRVAELGRSTSSAFQTLEPWPPQPLDEYSIEAWVKPQLFHHGEVLCLHGPQSGPNGGYPHTFMLETTARQDFARVVVSGPKNRFRFIHRALDADEPIMDASLFAEDSYQARVWQHVVAQTKDGKQMLWIDGNLSAEIDNPVPLTANVQILVGQVYPDSSRRRFVGQIDEVAIYDRCITPQEIKAHIHAAGGPAVD